MVLLNEWETEPVAYFISYEHAALFVGSIAEMHPNPVILRFNTNLRKWNDFSSHGREVVE